MGKKGQALIEFVIILPIFLIIVLSAIDFGNILLQKYKLESSLDYVITLKQSDKISELNTYLNEQKLTYSYNEENNTVTLKKKISVFAPPVKVIFSNPYIETEGIVYE